MIMPSLLRPRRAAAAFRAIGALALLAGCTAQTQGGCGARSLPLDNRSALPVEQAYAGDGAPGGWGPDLLRPADLPPGARRVLALPAGARALRLVWANGRAAEMHGVDLCAVSALTLTETGLLPR